MRMVEYKIFNFILMISAIIIINFSCETIEEPEPAPLKNDEYLLLDLQSHISGKHLRGGYSWINIDGFGFYKINYLTGDLRFGSRGSKEKDNIKNANTILLYLCTINPDYGGGCADSYKIFNSFPDTFTILQPPDYRITDSLIINKINSTAFSIRIRNTPVILRKKTSVTFILEHIFSEPTLEYLITDSLIITNYGRQDKNKISFQY
jgi:hypothetical protein